MKKFGIGLAALSALVLVSAPADAQDKPGAGIKICLSLDKMNAFREGQLKYWRIAAEDLGVELVEQVAGEDAQRQSSQIDTCIAQGVDGIISIPWDYEAVLQDIARAHDAGIPFVTADQAPAETDTVDFHIGADPHADGLNAGKRLVVGKVDRLFGRIGVQRMAQVLLDRFGPAGQFGQARPEKFFHLLGIGHFSRSCLSLVTRAE